MTSAVTRRIWFWVPMFAALLIALVWMFRPRPVFVDLATVARGPLLVSVSDEGETRVRDVFVVSAPVPGLMRRIELEAGDTVVADDTVIAHIEPSDPSFLDRRTEAEARAARIELKSEPVPNASQWPKNLPYCDGGSKEVW